jgi:MFS family permease
VFSRAPRPGPPYPRVTPPRESLASQRLWLAFSTMLLVAGITNTFPVFLPALLAESGGSRAATASTASLLWIGGALLSPVAGYLVARWNPRRLVCLGLAIVAGGMLLGILAPTLPLFLVAMGIGGGIGLGLTGMTTHAALIADAYVRRRGLATGIAFGGSMAAYALAPPAQWIITRWGSAASPRARPRCSSRSVASWPAAAGRSRA